MYILDIHEIQECCDKVLSRVEKYDIYSFFLMETMFKCGCRVSESFSFKSWEVTGPSDVVLFPQKNNNKRIFSSSDVNHIFYSHINNSNWLAWRYNKSRLSRYFNLYNPFPALFVSSKPITCHLFRHNKIKQMYHQGFTVEEIQDYFGEISPSNIRGYIYSEIYYL